MPVHQGQAASGRGAVLTGVNMQSRALQSRELRGIRVAIASTAARERLQLQRALAQYGMRVVMSEPPSELFAGRLANRPADILVMDMHADLAEPEVACLEHLLDTTTLPMVFNDMSVLRHSTSAERALWYGKLLRKIADIHGRFLDAASLDHVACLPNRDSASAPLHRVRGLAENVWVLGASLGGPEAVKRFLRVIPADLPVAFVLAQHLGSNFVELLAEQLGRDIALRVCAPLPGHVLRHGEVLIAPVDERLIINTIGALELHAPVTGDGYRPSITRVIRDITTRYGSSAGTIIFSGLGNDGAQGCGDLAAEGGQIWVQNAQSCVISSMPDEVRKRGVAGFEGTPEALAQQLIERYSR